VAGLPHVKGVTPRIEFFGMVSNGSKSPVYMALAVDPAADERMGFRPQVLEGRNLSPVAGDGAHEVLVARASRAPSALSPATGSPCSP